MKARTSRPTLVAVDSHTCGQPTRVILDGLPQLDYATIDEAREILRDDHDWIRRCAVLEPRGHRALFAVALVPPVDPTCATGAVFMDAVGYHDMCGHATIGLVTTLLEDGVVPMHEGVQYVAVETPAGRIETHATVVDGTVTSVTFVNQPAFSLSVVNIETPIGDAEVGIAYGGQWYGFVDAEKFDLRIEPEHIAQLVRVAAEIRPAIAAAVTERDPRTGRPPRVENVMWVDRPRAGADGRNMPVNAADAFDRSPCGTGTCARLALLHGFGALDVGASFVNSGVLGTTYTGRVVEETAVETHPAVVPEITGAAWLTAKSRLSIDPDDPLGEGFLL
jgi:proline racemase